MRKIFMKNLFILMLLLCVSCASDMTVSENNSPYWSSEQLLDVTGLRLYPFVPFTEEEWREMSYDDKLARRQIPEDFLHGMSTTELFYQYAFTDLSGSMFMSNIPYNAFRHSISQFNMLTELLNRPDVGAVILGLLEKIDINKIETKDIYFWYHYLQVIAAQPEVINSLTDAGIKSYIFHQLRCHDAIKLLSKVNNEKWTYPRSAEMIIMGFCNTMIISEYEPFIQLYS